jgi:hypothetical protein
MKSTLLIDGHRQFCVACQLTRPIRKFPKFKGGKRHHTCIDCMRKLSEGTTAEMKREVVKTAREMIGRDVLAAKFKVPHQAEITEAVIRSFGGVQEFVDFYKQQIDEAVTSQGGMGSKKVLDACHRIITLVGDTNKLLAGSANDPSLLTDEDLEREVLELSKRHALANPEFIKQEAKRLEESGVA